MQIDGPTIPEMQIVMYLTRNAASAPLDERANNDLVTGSQMERLNKEIRRRTRVVGSFPDTESAIMLIAARLRYTMAGKWGAFRYMNMELLKGGGGEIEAA